MSSAKVVFDSSAILALVFGETGADVAAQALPGGVVSAVNVAEVVTRLIDLGSSEAEALEALATLGLSVRVFDEALAVSAARLRTATRGKGLSLGDRACIAQGLREGRRVLTADRAWAGLNLGIEVTLIR